MIFYLLLYLTVGMCFLSSVWVYQSIKKLTKGLLRNFLRYILLITIWGLIFSTWIFCLSVDLITVPDESFILLSVGVYVAILFLIVSRMAICAKKLGETYGFRE